jgi:type II secretory pathway pseudopilin PulG
MRRIARRFSSPIVAAVVVALVVGATASAAAPQAVTSVVKFAKRATFAKRAGKATRAKYATTAGKAKRSTLALSAKVANNSSGLGGHPASAYSLGPNVQHISFRARAGTGETALLDTGAFALTASCNSNGLLRILATTRVDHADIESLGNGGDTQIDDFSISDSPRNLGPTQGETRSIMYTDQAGQLVYVHYMASAQNYPPPGSGDPNPDHGAPLGGAIDCLVEGFATVQ